MTLLALCITFLNTFCIVKIKLPERMFHCDYELWEMATGGVKAGGA